MSAATHTPGPWFVEQRGSLARNYIKAADGGWIACGDRKSVIDDESDANARLIAAAPLLLEVMREVEEMLSARPEFLRGNSKVHFMAHKARAAIAKATTP